MSALLLAVFIASVVGSLHCAGMCGPLLACAVTTPTQPNDATQHPAVLGQGFSTATRRAAFLAKFKLQAAYHLGRLVSYAVLGTAAGSVGALLDLGGLLSGLQPVAAMLAGIMMILIGLAALSQGFGGALNNIALPKWWTATLTRAQQLALRLPPAPRAALIGLSTTLLPCGWLYAFAVTAAGTSSAVWGAAVMAVFWLGTLPVMVTLGAGLQGLIGFAGRRLPLATGIAMIAIGILTLTNRLGLDPQVLAAAVEQNAPTTTHSEHAVPDASQTPACCPLGEATENTETQSEKNPQTPDPNDAP